MKIKKIKDSKIQKTIQREYIDEMGISANLCNDPFELEDTFDDIRRRISLETMLTTKQKNDLIIASKFAQVIIQKRFNKKGVKQ